jgi:hypothetical protein
MAGHGSGLARRDRGVDGQEDDRVNREAVEYSARTAGGVRRYHTWPVLRPQTVAEHTWHVMRIWWQVYGPMSPAVSSYLLLHDAGEGQAGDVQFGAKRRYPELKAILDRIESDQLQVIVGPDRALDIVGLYVPDRDLLRAKACDLLEMAEFAADEMLMGNRLASPIWTTIEGALVEHTRTMEKAGDPVGARCASEHWADVHKRLREEGLV